MTLEEKINSDIKAAMLAREQEKLEAIRAIKAALLLEKTKENGSHSIDETTELNILQRLVKQRKESAELYRSGNRQAMAEKELLQASIIQSYLPKQMGREELTGEIRKIIESSGATGIKDMGKVMGIASGIFAGRADNKTISGIIKELLTG